MFDSQRREVKAERAAMIGFAGPRVIKDTTQAEVPTGFQTAEFLLDHGLIDAIVSRREMKQQLISYLDGRKWESSVSRWICSIS